MARFLFTSVPVEGHTASPLAIMAALTASGHEVTWLAGARHADRARRVGVTHVPVHLSTDFSLYDDVFDVRPDLRHLEGIPQLKATFREVFLGDAGPQVHELEQILSTFPADVIVSSGPQFGPALLAERTGIPHAVIGDGPFAVLDRHTPPFGPGLRPWPGPIGRARNRVLNGAVRRMFADVQRTWIDVRRAHGLDAPDPWVFDAMAAGDLVLQGCVHAFEYRRPFPPSVHFIGALRPLQPDDWQAPEWWPDLDGWRPVVHVTQGTIRVDPAELIRPVIDALAGEHVLVVVTTGPIDPADLGPLPANVRTSPFIPYERLLERASLFVTNGGYIGTNLALHHGVPVLQIGDTEEKAEIGARVAHLGLGRAFRKLPSRPRLRSAIREILDDDALHDRVSRASADYRAHDAPTEAAALLVDLARNRTPVDRTRAAPSGV